jgi:hypothetical protein
MNALVMSAPERPTFCDLMRTSKARELGFVFPKWKTENYRGHVTEIKEQTLSYLAKMPSVSPANGEKVQAIYWTRYSTSILQSFESGFSNYQTASFDIDGDGLPEEIHRISLLFLDSETDAWRPATCGNSHQRRYRTYLDRPGTGNSATGPYQHDLRGRIDGEGQDLNFLHYRDHAFWLQTGGLVATLKMVRQTTYGGEIRLLERLCWTGIIQHVSGWSHMEARNVQWPAKIDHSKGTPPPFGCGR